MQNKVNGAGLEYQIEVWARNCDVLLGTGPYTTLQPTEPRSRLVHR